METRTELQRGPDGATAEVVTLVHEGREFSALGAVVDPANGYVVGYVSSDGKSLTDSGGVPIFAIRQVSTWTRRDRWGWTRFHAYRGVFRGRTYSGRGLGESCLLRMRARK